ncbi:hypothetical protein FUA23_10895 [Neolewinella aurantiaca]|uniref:Uncharacterized protein n=1 Tax=Neolewinella aurantiaca TaxID=2602767 RepID=A0A5C7FNR9_9BACT|nr:hypothetical protein [Neolewinella aurantiaca]TXF89250.1 hypothetical protein FUA23_10895 [Neolewinella aurantiaca]
MLQDISYDQDLLLLPHYQNYPQMLPLIGSHYRRMNKQVLVIGESHYLRKESEGKREPVSWYDGTATTKLDQEDRNWIHTRGTAGSGIDQKYGSKAFSIYRNVEYAIKELLEGEDLPTNNYLRYTAYYNYFLRPAKTGLSLDLTAEDKTQAYNHLVALVGILQPTHLAFVSKLAYRAFWDFHQESELFFIHDVFGTAHPGCRWWNSIHKHDFWGEKERMTSRDWFLKRVGKLFVN